MREAQDALLTADAGIFQRGGQLVRIVRLEERTERAGIQRAAGSVIITPITREYLILALARAAAWKRYDGRAKKLINADPPGGVAGALLAMVGEWRFPVLSGLTAAPTLRADGSLLDCAGYDPPSGLYGAFERADFPDINPAPTRDEALDALAKLSELFEECAFADWNPVQDDSVDIAAKKSAHASVAIAATITACVRHALPTAPAFGVSAYKASSGKTTLARTISHVCTGREPPVLALSDDETEFRKCLLGILIAGDACVLIDNVAHPVDSAALCAVLTNASYADRVLGVNQKITVPTASTWLLTGNHLEFVGDLTSRVLLSVLDPQVEHPEARKFNRDLAAYVAEHRGEIVAAALAVPLAYLAAGSPACNAQPSRFTEWDRFVRRPLLWLGLADPLRTQAELRAIDPVRTALIAVMVAWEETFGSEPTTVANAVEAATDVTVANMRIRLGLFEALAEIAGERNGSLNNRRLGRWLARHLRRIESGRRFEDAGEDLITHRRRFRVVSVSGVTGVTGVSGVSANPTREMSATNGDGS
ncbi:MAG: hypothetical protein ACREUL_17760 [Steroidobacteraceae bacterium]